MVILVYQIYSHGGQLVKKHQELRRDLTKSLTSNHAKSYTKRASTETKGSEEPVKRRELRKTEHASPLLQKEVKRLKSRINQKDDLIERLTAQLEKEKSQAKKIQTRSGQLESSEHRITG